MNKVICNLCGTSYPENAAQCPICGFARDIDGANGSSEFETYTYVKGGSFSKSNVKKRNKTVNLPVEEKEEIEKKTGKKSNVGLMAVVVILLLAIVAVLGYTALRFFYPNSILFEGLDNLKIPFISQQKDNAPQSETAATDVSGERPCSAITISTTNLQFFAAGVETKLVISLEPANTTDPLIFTSSDASVATIDEDGTVTSVGSGTAVITASCGEHKIECTVNCIFTVAETEPVDTQFTLNRKEITFSEEGQSWLLYDGAIPISDIEWTSDNSDIATIENGNVVAIGNGDTTVYGNYNGSTVSCLIHCSFNADSADEAGNISEAGSNANKVYKLYNPTGYADDVTLSKDESFTLMLVDDNNNEVTDAVWNIADEKVCSYSNKVVTALKSGTTEITATYNGATYTCVVRVN